MYSDSNERRAFQRRKDSLFRKGYEFQKKFQARVYIVIERHGTYHVYRHSQRTSNWPPYHETAEIRAATTVFPSDFQTVRDADRRGPVSSDVEETTSLRVLSHEGPVPTRSADEDDAYHDADGKMDQYPAPSYHGRVDAGPTYLGNPDSLSVQADIRGTSMWKMDAMEGHEGEYSYGVDGSGATQGFEESATQPLGDGQSPAGNVSARAGVDVGWTTQTGMGRGLRESRLQEPAAKHLFAGAVDQAQGEPNMELDSVPDLDQMIPRGGPRHGSMGGSLLGSGPATARKAHVFDERASQQLPPRGRPYERFDVMEKKTPSGIEHQRPTFTGRGPTPDQSPQKFTVRQGRRVHGVASSPGRRPAPQSLNQLPKVPPRDRYKS